MLLDDYKNINKKLTAEEVEKELIMQEDFDAIVEFIRESGYLDITDEYSVYNEATIRTNNSSIALTKAQLESRVRSMAALSAAKEKNPDLYKKYRKVAILKRKLMNQILKQNLTVAKKSAKAAIKEARRQSGPTLKNKSNGVSGTKGTPNKVKTNTPKKSDSKK